MTASRRLAAVLAVGFCVAGPTVALRAGAEVPGDAGRGQALFVGKHCARCHLPPGQPGAGPALDALRRPQGAFELAGRFWNHAPAMFTTLTQEGIPWPEIAAAEMADLMAYLQADPARDPAPDLARGHVTLVRKGCLKCHTLRGEGRRIGPDLSRRQPSYADAVAWAAGVWRHTPSMARKALEERVLYPRFVGDEMTHLVAFLRAASAASP